MTRKVARRCSWLPVIPSSQIELCFSARVDQWSHSKWSKSAGRGAYGSDFTVSNALWESDFQITTKSPARCPLFTCDEVYWINFIASESVDIVRESLFVLIRCRYKTHVKQHTKWFPTAGDITDGRPSFIVQPPRFLHKLSPFTFICPQFHDFSKRPHSEQVPQVAKHFRVADFPPL